MILHGVVHRALAVADLVRVDSEGLKEFVQRHSLLKDGQVLDPILDLPVLQDLLKGMLETTGGVCDDAFLNAMLQELPNTALLVLWGF